MTSPYGLLIIGGGPAGLAAARSYRALRSDGRVGIVTDEGLVPYNRPPLTKDLLRGESSLADLPIEPEEWFETQQVDLISGRAVALDPVSRAVHLSGGRTLAYTHCLIATGGEPRRLAIPGADHPRVAVIRALDDLRRLQARLSDGARVAVIGSGFIACEIAASLRMLGHAVQMISTETAPNVSRLGGEAASAIGEWLTDAGVVQHPGCPVERIDHGGGVSTVVSGELQVPAEIVIMGSGVTPRSELLRGSELTLDGGAIPVGADMRTSVPGLLAAGDVAKAENLTARRALTVEHWGDALGQGEVAGKTAAGAEASWDAVPGFWSTVGSHTLKYVAWGDGYDECQFTRHADGGFTVRYGQGGTLVGVLTHDADEDYDRAYSDVAEGTPWT